MKKHYLSFLFLLTFATSFSQCWEQLAGGYFHSLGIQTDGSLWAWGSNTYGQLGDGTTTDRNIPTRIGTDVDWVYVTAGQAFSVGIKSNGTLWVWGRNNKGQLGNNTMALTTVPIQLGSDMNWETASAGYEYIIAKKTDDTLWSWGNDDLGQLGQMSIFSYIPTMITETDWYMVTTGFQSSLGLKNNGTMWGWGSGANGCLADGNPTAGTDFPEQYQNNLNFKKITMGQSTVIGLKYDGTLWGWGANQAGGVGIGVVGPPGYILDITQIGADTSWQKVNMGRYDCKAIKTDGSLWTWGYNHVGQAGDGTTTIKSSPIQVGMGNQWFDAVGGEQHTLAISQNRSLWAWGGNANGQLGDGTFTNKLTPTSIGTPCNLGVQQIDSFKAMLFPNPASQVINVQVIALQNFAAEVTIFNTIGQVVHREDSILENGLNTTSINVASLPQGVYTLKLKTQNQTYCEKWIKK